MALGLLLVFRTNASYERFWEARKLWGSIVNESRNLARMAAAYLRDQPGVLESVILWGAAFFYAAMNSLRGAAALGPIAARLPREEVAHILAAPNVPAAVALHISDCLAQAWKAGYVTDRVAMSVDGNAQLLVITWELASAFRRRRCPSPTSRTCGSCSSSIA